jgi:ABC-type nitrate/sulfonate/bicarbonate transport system substrate-binding protein
MIKTTARRLAFLTLAWLTIAGSPVSAQTLDKMRLGYSGTGINNYVLEIGKRLGIFRRNGLDLEVVYVNSGSLLNQALIAGTFDVSFSQGSEAMLAKLRGADMRIIAVVANRFNHVYIAAPSIKSLKQLKGKTVAVSRFGSGSHFQTNLALKEGGLDPDKDVTILQIGNSGARMAAILSGAVEGNHHGGRLRPEGEKRRIQHSHRSRRDQDRISLSLAQYDGRFCRPQPENDQSAHQRHVGVDPRAADRHDKRQNRDSRGAQD